MSQGEQPAATIGQLAGEVIGGRYRLGERLGQGGMGVVYAATQESLARPVALKVLQPVLAQNEESILRFRAEAERAGRLAHPHIVQILDFGLEPGRSAWIAMELLKGESLAARIARGPLSEAEAVRIARETLSALEAAHAAHLVHRDLKPDNIFLADVPGIGASVKVLDFGIAKLLDDESAGRLTATGMLIGTPLYMAPEQARGADVDQRADLYSLGAVLYEALTGGPPFTGKNYNALLFSVLSETPAPIASVRPDISPELARVIARAMEKDPAARWQSAHEMADALRALEPSEHRPIMRPPSHAPLATAPTMATPIPAEPLGATTPALGGMGDAIGSAVAVGALESAVAVGAVGSAVGRATPPTRTTTTPFAQPSPLASTPAPTTSPVPSRAAKTQQGFRWWPIALAGGTLAVATLAFVSVGTMSLQPASDKTVSVAAPPTAPSTQAPSFGEVSVKPLPAATPPTAADVPRAPGQPGPARVTAAQADSDSESDAHRHRPTRDPGTKTVSPRRVPRPNVDFSGGTFGRMPSSEVRARVLAEGDWGRCWPTGVPGPEANRGRDFQLDVAADGRVLSAEPVPNSREPLAFSSCVVAKLRRLTLPPPPTGEVAHIRIGFTVENP